MQQVSVIICNYNYGEYIRFSLDGIVSQTVTPLELILVDDGSTDDSVAIIKEYVEKYPWIRFFQNKENRGAYESAQFALLKARGEYVYFGCSDDRVMPDFIEKSMECARLFPEAGLVCSQAKYFKSEAEMQDYEALPSGSVQSVYIFPQKILKLKRKNFKIQGHTSVYRKDFLLEAGGVIEAIGHNCDWFFSHVIALRAGLAYLNCAMAYKREHPKNLSVLEKKDFSLFENMLDLFESPPYRDVRRGLYAFALLNEKREGIIQAFLRKKKYPLVLVFLIVAQKLHEIKKRNAFVSKSIERIRSTWERQRLFP